MTSYQKQTFDLIQSLTGEKNILAIPREFIHFTGDPVTAIFLSQLVYWTGKGTRKDGYIFKSDKEWQDELGLTNYALRKARDQLTEMGILLTKLKKANGAPTLHYKIDQEAFADAFLRYRRIQSSKSKNGLSENEESLTETTTETTHKDHESLRSSYYIRLQEPDGASFLQLALISEYAFRYRKKFPDTNRQIRVKRENADRVHGRLVEIESTLADEECRELVQRFFEDLPDGKTAENLQNLEYFAHVLPRFEKEQYLATAEELEECPF